MAADTPDPAKIHYREQWLHEAINALRPPFTTRGYTLPAEIHVSVGWPSTGGRQGKGGETWETSTSADGKAHVFVSPLLGDPLNVVSELVHLLGHVVTTAKHTANFVRWMTAFGMEGIPKDALPGSELRAELKDIVDTLGTYPHAKITPHEHSKQGTRLLKVICPDCGYVIRVTRKWLDEGCPTCPCNGLMIEADDEAANDPLDTTNATHEFSAYDGRFKIVYMKVMHKGNIREQRWLVTDWQAGDDDARVTPLATREDVLAFMLAVNAGVYVYQPRTVETIPHDELPDAAVFAAEEAALDADEAELRSFDEADGVPADLDYLAPTEVEDAPDELDPTTVMRLRKGGEWVEVEVEQDPVGRGAGVDDQGQPVEMLPEPGND